MEIENTEDFLRKFDYCYERHNNELIVEMDFSQSILIDFSNPKDIVITDKLIGWNFLTGIINMSIKNAVFFNLLFGSILSLMVAFIDLKTGIFIFVGVMIWAFSWSAFYFSKKQTLRRFLINWNK